MQAMIIFNDFFFFLVNLIFIDSIIERLHIYYVDNAVLDDYINKYIAEVECVYY